MQEEDILEYTNAKFLRGVNLSLKINNHMRSQHILKTPYIRVFNCKSSNAHTISMIKIQVTICTHKSITFIQVKFIWYSYDCVDPTFTRQKWDKSELQVETGDIESANLLKPPSNHEKLNKLQARTQNVKPCNADVQLLQDKIQTSQNCSCMKRGPTKKNKKKTKSYLPTTTHECSNKCYKILNDMN
jgi:hypothetical protein